MRKKISLFLIGFLGLLGVSYAQDSPKDVFERLKEAYHRQDLELYKSCLTPPFEAGIEGMVQEGVEYELPQDVIYVSEEKKDNRVIINCIEITKNGEKRKMKYIFVKEEGEWKCEPSPALESPPVLPPGSNQQPVQQEEEREPNKF